MDRWTSPTGEHYLRLAMLGFPGGIELYFSIPEPPHVNDTDCFVWPAAGRTTVTWILDGERVEIPLSRVVTPTPANESESCDLEPVLLQRIMTAERVEVELDPGRRLVLVPRHQESLRILTGAQIWAPILR